MKITIEHDNISIIINIEKDKTIGNLKTKIWLLTDIPFSYIELWYPLGMSHSNLRFARNP